MSDEKKYTERELVLAKRHAFVDGSYWGYKASQEAAAKSVGVLGAWSRADADMASESAYPFPKVTRPRVVQDPHDSTITYRAVDDLLEYNDGLRGFIDIGSTSETWSNDNYPTKARVVLWADLLANPTEEVEA